MHLQCQFSGFVRWVIVIGLHRVVDRCIRGPLWQGSYCGASEDLYYFKP